MLSDNMYRVVLIGITVGNYLGFIPFRIDRKVGKASVDFVSQARALHNWLWLVVYTSIVLPTHLLSLHAKKDFHNFNFTMVWVNCGEVAILIVGVVVLKPTGISRLCNGVFKLIQDFPDKYISNYNLQLNKKWNNLIEIMMVVVYWAPVLLASMMAIHCFLRPESPLYLTYGMDERYLKGSWYILASSWFSWFCLSVATEIGMFALVGLIYFCFLVPIVTKELRLGLRTYKTDDILREHHHLVLTWRAFEILMKNINYELGIVIVYIQFVVTNVVLFCNVTLVYYWDGLRWNLVIFLICTALYSIFAWSLFLFVAGRQHYFSQRTIASWKMEYWILNKKDQQYMQRVKLSCRPTSVGDGKRFVIRPTSVLKFFDSVSCNTFRALITYGKISRSFLKN